MKSTSITIVSNYDSKEVFRDKHMTVKLRTYRGTFPCIEVNLYSGEPYPSKRVFVFADGLVKIL